MASSTSPNTLILGAGLAGLSTAHHLGGDYLVLERDREVGGTAQTHRRGDFFFDCTGHWLHLRDAGIEALVKRLMGEQLTRVDRRAEIHSHGVRTPFPFQANTYGLPVEVAAACVLGYFKAREAGLATQRDPPRNFEEFIRQRMGDGIADHFMVPYNQKLWTVPPSEMAHTWCERFVPLPTPEEVVRGALAPAGAGEKLGYNSSFWYPRAGGIGRLPATLASSLTGELRRQAQVVRVDAKARRVRTAAGDEHSYRELVSTLPLTDLVAALSDAPDAVRAASAKLRSTSVTYWDLGLASPNGARDAHWIYFPDPQLPFYRAGSASAAVATLAPAGHRSLYVEVSHRRGSACPASTADVLRGLRAVGLVGPTEEPVQCTATTIDCAYVIMDADYGAARSLILDWLSGERIYSVGRYGAWTYDSMEGAMIQGREAAARARAA